MSAAKQVTTIDENEAMQPQPAAESVSVSARKGGTNSEPVRPSRRRLPDERLAITHHFSIAGHEGYLTVGLYEDGSPGEIFITIAKQGSTISGLMDSFATVVSLALQHGVPLEVLCAKFSHTRFEPSGWSGNPKIGYATSIVDYMFRWLQLKFITGAQGELFRALPIADSSPTDPNGPIQLVRSES